MKTQIFNPLSLKIVNDNMIIISNYTNIIDFDSSNIIIDNYSITGENLLITRIDELRVDINGKIKKVEIT